MEVIKFILFSFLNYNGVWGTVTLTREISCVISSGPKKHPSSALTGQMNTCHCCWVQYYVQERKPPSKHKTRS